SIRRQKRAARLLGALLHQAAQQRSEVGAVDESVAVRIVFFTRSPLAGGDDDGERQRVGCGDAPVAVRVTFRCAGGAAAVAAGAVAVVAALVGIYHAVAADPGGAQAVEVHVGIGAAARIVRRDQGAAIVAPGKVEGISVGGDGDVLAHVAGVAAGIEVA